MLPKITPIPQLSHKEQFRKSYIKVNKFSLLQDLSCLFELYLEPLQNETFLTQDEVRENLKDVLFILLWVKSLPLGFFVAESMTEKANNKDYNRNYISQCLSVWCFSHFKG